MFKVGDKVYFPDFGSGIFELVTSELSEYSLLIKGGGTFDFYGRSVKSSKVQHIFHATKENKVKLEALYGIEFEEPKLTGSDLTRKLLSDGHNVLCYVSDISEDKAIEKQIIRIIIFFEHGRFCTHKSSVWKHAVPIGKDFEFVVGE